MLGIVAIGRNEGERLRDCLRSLPPEATVVYVDSGSTDRSTTLARELGAEVVDLDLQKPFTAARARNAGFKRLEQISSDVEYVQFIDGDCSLCPTWLDHAVEHLKSHDDVGAVSGRRRERFPERSIYNQLCDWEWEQGKIGQADAFGGDVVIRAKALLAVGGYRDDLIAGEDPELALRLRMAGWKLWRLDTDMTVHDAALTQFKQWWRRSTRSGYAFAQGAHLHGATNRYRVWESHRAWLWAFWLPLVGITLILVFGPIAGLFFGIYLVQFLRQLLRNKGSLRDRAALSFFQILSRFAENIGQLKYLRDRIARRQAQLIEYK